MADLIFDTLILDLHLLNVEFGTITIFVSINTKNRTLNTKIGTSYIKNGTINTKKGTVNTDFRTMDFANLLQTQAIVENRFSKTISGRQQ